MYGKPVKDLTQEQQLRIVRDLRQAQQSIGIGKPMDSTQANTLGAFNDTISSINQILQLPIENFVGKIEGVKGAIREFTGIASEDEITFRTLHREILEAYLRALTGAAAPPAEKKEIRRVMGAFTNDPAVFRQKLATVGQRAMRRRDAWLTSISTPISEQVGRQPALKIPGQPAPAKPTSEMTIQELLEYLKGQ